MEEMSGLYLCGRVINVKSGLTKEGRSYKLVQVFVDNGDSAGVQNAYDYEDRDWKKNAHETIPVWCTSYKSGEKTRSKLIISKSASVNGTGLAVAGGANNRRLAV